MTLTPRISTVTVAIAFTAVVASIANAPGAQGVSIDPDDIGGVVTGPSGPEAGVWVIAETSDLPTKFVRIVVTDDRGRYVLPDGPGELPLMFSLLASKPEWPSGRCGSSRGGRRCPRP